MDVKATLMASDPAPVFLLQFSPAGLAANPPPADAVQLDGTDRAFARRLRDPRPGRA